MKQRVDYILGCQIDDGYVDLSDFFAKINF